MIVQYINQQRKYKTTKWRELIDAVLPAAFKLCEADKFFSAHKATPLVSVTFAGTRYMRQLNRDARQVDRLTDILSFPMLEFKHGKLDRPLADYDFDLSLGKKRAVPLGDLVISLDRAFEQAEQYGHSCEREIAFLVLHGLLHLLGYDHELSEDETVMRRMQRVLLEAAGFGKNN